MGRGRGDDDRGLAERDAADAVLGGGGLEPVPFDGGGDDRGDLLLRHLTVGLVVEEVDVARRALEGDDRPGRRPAHEVGDRARDERLLGDAHVGRRARAAADRRQQRQLVAGAQLGAPVHELTVDGHPHRQPREQIVERRAAGKLAQRVADGRAVGQRGVDVLGAGALAQLREESGLRDQHRIPSAYPRAPASRRSSGRWARHGV